MKKTFAILMAMAGVAMGAQEITLSGAGDTFDVSGETFVNGAASVAFILNDSVYSTLSDVATPLFYLGGVNISGDIPGTCVSNIGVSMRELEENGFAAALWRENTAYSSAPWTGGLIDLPMAHNVVVYTTMVFTVQMKDATRGTVTITYDCYGHNAAGDIIVSTENIKTMSQTQTVSYSDMGDCYKDFYINPNAISLENVKLFNGVIDNQQAVVTALVQANIPEPATATLSLLAFAGLAARRRRK